MHQQTYGYSSVVTTTSSKSRTYLLKKNKIFQEYSSDKKKFFQFSKQLITLSSTNKLPSIDSIQYLATDVNLKNRQQKTIKTAKKIQQQVDQQNNKIKRSPKSQIIPANKRKVLINSESKQSFLPHITNLKTQNQNKIQSFFLKTKQIYMNHHLSDPLYKLQKGEVDLRNMYKMKKYKKVWKQSINKRQLLNHKSLIERSLEKAKNTISIHNRQIKRRDQVLNFQDYLRNKPKQSKLALKGQICSCLQGLKGRGGKNQPLFQQIYIAQETYKFHK